ncbi:MAG: M28 family peptidase [Mangrovimonas sp.]|nr:M28 family peptidase [Mangrovimonas sp.]HPF97017.1 M28 family peptidase [Mangrovimonas sp.]
MKVTLIASILTLVGSCSTPKYSTKITNLKNSIKLTDSSFVLKYANTISASELKTHLYEFASEAFNGRATGEAGQEKAAAYLADYYKSNAIKSPINDSIYYQVVPKDYLPEGVNASENVLAYIEGSDYPEEVVIISAHLDHLGVTDGQINYGADDDGSGTVALMEMAKAFKMAQDDGYGPRRSILFLHVTAEEIGLQGSRYYTEHPVFELHNTLANLNIDMIGRVDEAHKDNKNYLYLIGSDRLSKELHYLSEKVNNAYFNLELDYKYNAEDDHNRYYYRSDHYNFAQKEIPVIFYFNGEHEDYHSPTDTPDKIEYPLLEKRTKLIFATAWQIANQDHRLEVDYFNY